MTDAPPPEFKPPSEDELMAAWAQEIRLQLPYLVGAFTAHLPPEEARRLLATAGQLVPGMVKEQRHLAKDMMPTLQDPETVKQMPTFVLRIFKTEGDRPGGPPIASTAVGLEAPKQLTDCAGDDRHVQALKTMLLWNFAMHPAVRLLLRLFGYHYDFVQQKPQSPIHLVKG